MCITASEPFDGNKTLVCTVGELQPGQRYRTPEGRTLMVMTLKADHDGYTRAVDVDSGEVFNPANSTKLGTDRAGRLYASRYLNPPAASPAVSAAVSADDKTCPYCNTTCVDASTKSRYVNGLKPKDANAAGCEFCNPLPY